LTLLFTDIQMPGSCDGMDLARRFTLRWPNILLVITSGQMVPTQAEIPDHGRFIGKPYRAKLASLIERTSCWTKWIT
jgi:hypothetical protein